MLISLVLCPISHAFNIGDHYTLNAYPDKPQVYIKIEGIYKHKVLPEVYEISFHGICLDQPFLKRPDIRPKFILDNTFISKKALRNSILQTSPKLKKFKTECIKRDELLTYSKEAKEVVIHTEVMIHNGEIDVQVSPITKNLSIDDVDKFSKLVFQN